MPVALATCLWSLDHYVVLRRAPVESGVISMNWIPTTEVDEQENVGDDWGGVDRGLVFVDSVFIAVAVLGDCAGHVGDGRAQSY